MLYLPLGVSGYLERFETLASYSALRRTACVCARIVRLRRDSADVRHHSRLKSRGRSVQRCWSCRRCSCDKGSGGGHFAVPPEESDCDAGLERGCFVTLLGRLPIPRLSAEPGMAAAHSGRIRTPTVLSLDVVTSTLEWFVVCKLTEAYLGRAALRGIIPVLVAVPIRFLTSEAASAWVAAGGAVLGCVAWRLLHWRTWWADLMLSICFCSLLAVRGLAPFHFTGNAAAFDWLPFDALFSVERQAGLLLILRKAFDYGASVWLLWRCRLNLWVAAILVAALLGTIEAAQRYLAGRVAEITDPLMALLIGVMFRSLRSPTPTPSSNRP